MREAAMSYRHVHRVAWSSRVSASSCSHARATRRSGRRPARKRRARCPPIVVLATGGTIAGAAGSNVQAGYTSGQVGVEQLIAAVPAGQEAREPARRADLEHRLAGHERRGLAQAGGPRQRAGGDARRGRRRDHARHRHDRGDRVLPEPRRQVEQAGGADGGDASGDGALGRRPAQLLQRRRAWPPTRMPPAAACWSSSTTGFTAPPR